MSRHFSEVEFSEWMAGERRPEAERHVTECAECARQIAAMQQTFAMFRDSGKRWSEDLYRETQVKPVGRAWLWRGLVASAACAVFCLVLLRGTPSGGHAPADLSVPPENSFMAIPYVAPLAPYERVSVVRQEVPVAALAAAGLEIHVPDTGVSVLADLVVGQDGRAHAIRLISNRSISQ